MLFARLASVILASARLIPTVRMNKPYLGLLLREHVLDPGTNPLCQHFLALLWQK